MIFAQIQPDAEVGEISSRCRVRSRARGLNRAASKDSHALRACVTLACPQIIMYLTSTNEGGMEAAAASHAAAGDGLGLSRHNTT